MKAIVVTGTPATGKTTVAKALICKGRRYLDLNSFAQDKGLATGYDKERACQMIDTDQLVEEIRPVIESSEEVLVIDSHLSHHIPPELVSVCIVTRCPLPELKRRLKDRGYAASKVRENLDSEIFDICLTEAREEGHNVLVFDTSKELIAEIKKAVDRVLQEKIR